MTVNPVLALLFSIVVVVSSKGHDGDIAPNATCLQAPSGAPGPPGPPGVNSCDEHDDGVVGPPEPPQPIGSVYSPTSCTVGLTRDNPASSCRDILVCNSSASSQNYWIRTESNVTRSMYCYMEGDKCGVRGMMRVVNIDMTDPGETCPSPLTNYTANERELCGGNDTIYKTCSSVTFPTFNYEYTHVCGRAVGFSFHHPCAFYLNQTSLDESYVSGLSITHGAPGSRTHIWTYAGGLQESTSHGCNCPCAKFPGRSPPSYVGDNYYCESATRYRPHLYQWFTNNTLWDNQDCYPGSNCCNNPRAPWFTRDLNTPTQDDVEIRWCSVSGVHFDIVATEQVEIYVY